LAFAFLWVIAIPVSGLMLMSLADAAWPFTLLVIAAIAAVFVVSSVTLRRHLAPRRHDRELAARMRRAFERAGPESTIAEADDRPRIRGRVTILQPVAGPDGDAAAFRARDVHDVEETVRRSGGRPNAVTKRYVTERYRCGRFAVDDGTGWAIVDDEAFELWRDGGMAFGADDALVVSEGDEVEVTGPAHRKQIAEYGETAGYRGKEQALVFDGSMADPIFVRLLEQAASD
jgi:hypothetical protein